MNKFLPASLDDRRKNPTYARELDTMKKRWSKPELGAPKLELLALGKPHLYVFEFQFRNQFTRIPMFHAISKPLKPLPKQFPAPPIIVAKVLISRARDVIERVAVGFPLAFLKHLAQVDLAECAADVTEEALRPASLRVIDVFVWILRQH